MAGACKKSKSLNLVRFSKLAWNVLYPVRGEGMVTSAQHELNNHKREFSEETVFAVAPPGVIRRPAMIRKI
jgi:hypothetical protein